MLLNANQAIFQVATGFLASGVLLDLYQLLHVEKIKLGFKLPSTHQDYNVRKAIINT